MEFTASSDLDLEAMLELSPQEFVAQSKKEVREKLTSLAKKVSPDGKEVVFWNNGERITFWWDGNENPQTLQMEGSVTQKTRVITIPVVDYVPGETPSSAIDFSYSADSRKVVIHNTQELNNVLPIDTGENDLDLAVSGMKWLMENLLYKSKQPLLEAEN